MVRDGGACREIEPEVLAHLVGWSVTRKELASRMRCSTCVKKAAEMAAVATPRPRGVPRTRIDENPAPCPKLREVRMDWCNASR